MVTPGLAAEEGQRTCRGHNEATTGRSHRRGREGFTQGTDPRRLRRRRPRRRRERTRQPGAPIRQGSFPPATSMSHRSIMRVFCLFPRRVSLDAGGLPSRLWGVRFLVVSTVRETSRRQEWPCAGGLRACVLHSARISRPTTRGELVVRHSPSGQSIVAVGSPLDRSGL